MQINSYKDLIVWQKAMRVVYLIYELTDKFPKEEQFGLRSQMTRAAISIPSNIAEGYRRGSKGEYLQFLNIANGSAAELETQLEIVKSIKKFNQLDIQPVYDLLLEVLKMLGSIIIKLKRI